MMILHRPCLTHITLGQVFPPNLQLNILRTKLIQPRTCIIGKVPLPQLIVRSLMLIDFVCNNSPRTLRLHKLTRGM